MEERYNVYFAGQVIDGFELDSVRDQLAKVFKADHATLDKLFSGKAQLIKRDCDKATALKYKETMERAGAVPLIKIAESTSTSTQAKPPGVMTAAERIAALAAAPDEVRFRQPAADTPSGNQHEDMAPDAGGIGLAPVGTAVLRDEERAEPITRELDTSGLAVDLSASRLSEEAPPPPAAPDTQHLSMGEVGDSLPNLPSATAPVSPNLEGISLSAAGTDFSDCAQPEPPPLPLDLSALVLANPGATLLDEKYRRQDHVVAPTTDHISLKE
ncbi:MAG TPA: hypothetical protein VIV27_01785 [Halioglobus sp.]